jgi:tetratricopeptide (TPR) repeat protein
MTSRNQSTLVRRLLFGALFALFAAPGCAMNQPDPELEHQLKRANSHFAIGIDHLDNGRYALGIREFLIAESLDPRNARIQVGLAEAYMHKGKAEEAEAHLLRALDVYPEFHDARLSLSALYLMTGREPQAAVQSRMLVDDPTFPATWRALTNLGLAEFAQGNHAEARKHLELAIEYNRSYWPALLTLGILAKQEGRLPEAVSYLRQVLEQKPAPGARAEANYHLAGVYITLGKRDQAVGHLKTAVAQTPDGKWGKKSEEYLKILR